MVVLFSVRAGTYKKNPLPEWDVKVPFDKIRNQRELEMYLKRKLISHFGYGKRRSAWRKFLEKSWVANEWRFDGLTFREFVAKIQGKISTIQKEIIYEGGIYRKWRTSKGWIHWRASNGWFISKSLAQILEGQEV
ncbi:MAG: hypothetical protein QXI58_02590 [Candidatus Micrarchaeia archaeon]